jgi:hypothetical protein
VRVGRHRRGAGRDSAHTRRPARAQRRRPSSWRALLDTPPLRSRRQHGVPTITTGGCSRSGVSRAGWRRCRPRRRRSPRSWRRRPTATCARSRSPDAWQRSPPRIAPRGSPARASRPPSPRCWLGSGAHGAVQPQRKAQALELQALARMIEPIDTETLGGLRDRALLLLGAAAPRRAAPSWSRSTPRTCASMTPAGY